MNMKRIREDPRIQILIVGIVLGIAIWFRRLGLGEGIQILIMLGLVFVTVQYAVSTYRMAKAMETELATRRPYLNLDNWHLPESSNQNLWRVNLKNFGTTPAYAVRLEPIPRLSGYDGVLPIQFTGAAALIMPGQWNQWTINLEPASELASRQHTRIEVEFVIRYRSAGHKPFKAWELRLVRTPDPAINNWDLVGEDSEIELVTDA